MCSEMPVIRETAGGICSPSGSAIRHACGCVTVLRTWAQPISRRCPRGAAAVAWQSITRTSRCQSGSDRLPSTICHDRIGLRDCRFDAADFLLGEQLLQPSLLQRLVGADREAIAPATN